MPKSTAYFTAEGIDYTYRFCGVTEIEYNFALNIDADTSQGGDIINEARRLPNQIRLSVVETDVEASPGWAASMLSALDSIRRNRVLCRLTTDMGSWDRMFIAEITATQDEMNQYGWAGDIVFMQYIPKSEQYYSSSSSGSAVWFLWITNESESLDGSCSVSNWISGANTCSRDAGCTLTVSISS